MLHCSEKGKLSVRYLNREAQKKGLGGPVKFCKGRLHVRLDYPSSALAGMPDLTHWVTCDGGQNTA